MSRTFTDQPAVRSNVPLLIGLVGPSGGGKTYSGLSLATGIQKVVGGEIYVIDTESNRSLHYADRFKFRHLPFSSPFSPLDYLQAIEHCVAKGAKTIMIDSTSHEHEGPGGVLEMHEMELERLSRGDENKRDKVNFLAWAKPKAERRRLINSILQMNVNLICCFRAKEKIKLKRGSTPIAQGWQPIAGEEFVFEMTLNCLLLPNANGVPTWSPEEKGEQQMIKLPAQFRSILTQGTVLSEAIGTKLAEWAKGGPVAAPAPTPVVIAHATVSDGVTYKAQSSKLSQCVNVEELKKAYGESYKIRGLMTAEEFANIDKLKEEVKASFAKPQTNQAPAAAVGEAL